MKESLSRRNRVLHVLVGILLFFLACGSGVLGDAVQQETMTTKMKPLGAATKGQQHPQRHPHVRIEYCTSWGMQRNYFTIKQFLESEFPSLRGHISGGNFPPPPFAVLLMKVLSFVHLFAIAAVLLGDKLWTFFPFIRSPPRWYLTAKEYPMQTFVALFFILPTFLQSFITTGAFEIMLDGEILFSKIQSGRFPNGPELIDIFTRAGFVR